MKPVTLGVIVGNRGFFPAHLCKSGRQTILKVLEEEAVPIEAPGGDLYYLVLFRSQPDRAAQTTPAASEPAM